MSLLLIVLLNTLTNMKRYKFEWFLLNKNTCEYSYLARYYDKDMDNIDKRMMNIIQKACKVHWDYCHVFDITDKPEYANKECNLELSPIKTIYK